MTVFELARTFSFAEITAKTGATTDTMRHWFGIGGLRYESTLDQLGKGRNSPTRLHHRSYVLLLLAMKFNQLGFGMKGGDAAELAVQAWNSGMTADRMAEDDQVPFLVARRASETGVPYLENWPRGAPLQGLGLGLDSRWGGGSAVILDPKGVGRVIAALHHDAAAREAV
jgi:hypothetical protein